MKYNLCMPTGNCNANAKRHFSIYQNLPQRNSNFFCLGASSRSLLGRDRSIVCFSPAFWVKCKHQHTWRTEEILQACGFHCIIRFRAFSSPRDAHQKARVTPHHPCKSHPTVIPHPSEEGLFCTLGRTTSSFTAFGRYCQS